MRFAYIALIVLATVFSMAWYKIVMQRSPVIYHGISHLSLLFSWYSEKRQLTRGIFQGTPFESVTLLVIIVSQCIAYYCIVFYCVEMYYIVLILSCIVSYCVHVVSYRNVLYCIVN